MLTEVDMGQPINNFDIAGEICALSCMDSTIRVLDLKDGQVLSELKGKHHSSKYHSSIKFTTDKKRLVQASEDAALVVYTIETKEAELLRGHTMPVISLDISGESIVSGSADSAIKTWKLI